LPWLLYWKAINIRVNFCTLNFILLVYRSLYQ
jgi:hypothetical protein